MNILILIIFLFLTVCKSYEKIPETCYKIEGIPGPEDFVFLKEENSFLISSHNRRNFELLGEIYYYNINTKELKIVKRLQEPKELSFRPHGMDFYNNHLYVILHGEELNSFWHGIAIYEWNGKDLIFKRLIENEKFHSPNDIAVLSENIFFITNDSKERGSYWELFLTNTFGINKGSIVVCDIIQNKCEYAQEKLGFPNGIAIYKNQLFVTTTLENKLYQFDIINQTQLINKKLISKIFGGDNIILLDNKLYITSHPSLWKFLRHSSNTEKFSPSLGYEIDISNYNTKLIFSDNGQRLSASSVLLKLDQDLYIGQVFDPFIMNCKNINNFQK